MTLYIETTESVIFQTDDFAAVPNVGESIMVEGEWYVVVGRNFYFRHLKNIDDNSVSLFVRKTERV